MFLHLKSCTLSILATLWQIDGSPLALQLSFNNTLCVYLTYVCVRAHDEKVKN